jgi:hypothetical protein
MNDFVNEFVKEQKEEERYLIEVRKMVDYAQRADELKASSQAYLMQFLITLIDYGFDRKEAIIMIHEKINSDFDNPKIITYWFNEIIKEEQI